MFACRQHPTAHSSSHWYRHQLQVSLDLYPVLALTTGSNFYYDQDTTAFTPLKVRINEARLVDGMLPLSKITVVCSFSSVLSADDTQMGKTGNSVVRNYLNALDLLVPIEAPVTGITATPSTGNITGRRKVIKERYDNALAYLTSFEEDAGVKATNRSKLAKYVEKQENWAKAVQMYAEVQERQ